MELLTCQMLKPKNVSHFCLKQLVKIPASYQPVDQDADIQLNVIGDEEMQHIPHAGAVTSDSFLVFLLPTSYLIDFFFGLSKNAKHLRPLKT